MTNLLPEMKEKRTEIDNLDRSKLSIGDRAYLQEVTIRIAKKMAELESYLRQ